MLGKTLLMGAIIGGVVYALLKTQRQGTDEHRLHREEQSRWEGEGGAPIPYDEGVAATV